MKGIVNEGQRIEFTITQRTPIQSLRTTHC